MTKRTKRVQKVRNNPKTVRFEVLHRILLENGFEMRQSRSGSSHHIYCRDELQLSVLFKRPYLKEIYVKRVLEIIGDEL